MFAIHQEGGYSCVEVFFFRTGQNWGNRAYFPRAEKSFTPEEVLASFLAQFYDDKPPPKLILLSHEIEESELLADALSIKAGFKVEVSTPRRGEKKELIAHALTNAREALGRKLADTATQSAAAAGRWSTTLGLPQRAEADRGLRQQPHPGHQRGRRDDRRRARRLHQEPVPQVQHQVRRPDAGRRLRHDARGAAAPLQAAADAGRRSERKAEDDDSFPQWPDLVIIDGGRGQLNAAREIFDELGLTQVTLLAVAKGPDRDAGRETLFMPDREAIKLEPRDPVLYFIQRLRDEAHRFVIGSHRKLRKKDIREAGLQEIPGIGPSRKRALLHHFGTLKEIERASIADLGKVPGVSAESARKIFEFFHAGPG